ncbi:Cytochrome c oxidase assembly protein cox11, mitochondrial, partial [Dinochytrium kinnereticum]
MSAVYYAGAAMVTFLGLAYAAVPLYQVLCSQTGTDGTPMTSQARKFDAATMKPVTSSRKLKIQFESSMSDSMKWKFVPQTREISVLPGETALAFYTAENPTDTDIVGISTYSVTPAKA